MMSEMFLVLMMFSLGGGNGGDLLDYTEAQAYWQAQDQRIINVETMTQVLGDDDATPADRLMAIRALGEVCRTETATAADRQAAVVLLTGLTESEVPFEAEYAARSLAWISGDDPAPRERSTPEQMAQDLTLLSDDCNMVVQWRLRNGTGPADWDTLLPVGFAGALGGDREEMLQELSTGVVEFVDMVGNVRIDAVTFGMDMTSDEPEHIAVIVRGEYNRIEALIAIEDFIENESPDGGETNLYSIGDTEIISYEDGDVKFAILLPSDELIVWMMNIESVEPLAIDQTVQRIAAAGSDLTFTSELMTAEIQKIDREAAGAWMAMEIPAVLRAEAAEVFGPFDAAHIYGIMNDEGTIDLAWEAVGNDADTVTQATAVMNSGLDEARGEMQQMIQQQDDETKQMMGPAIMMLESIHLESDGATMTGGMSVDGAGLMSLPMLMFMGF